MLLEGVVEFQMILQPTVVLMLEAMDAVELGGVPVVIAGEVPVQQRHRSCSSISMLHHWSTQYWC